MLDMFRSFVYEGICCDPYFYWWIQTIPFNIHRVCTHSSREIGKLLQDSFRPYDSPFQRHNIFSSLKNFLTFLKGHYLWWKLTMCSLLNYVWDPVIKQGQHPKLSYLAKNTVLLPYKNISRRLEKSSYREVLNDCEKLCI